WPKVLCYFLETFRQYQRAPASTWAEPYVRAYTKHLHHNMAPSIAANLSSTTKSSRKSPSFKATTQSGSSPAKKRYTAEEKAQQICQAYNLEDKKCKPDCPYGRRYVCIIKGCE